MCRLVRVCLAVVQLHFDVVADFDLLVQTFDDSSLKFMAFIANADGHLCIAMSPNVQAASIGAQIGIANRRRNADRLSASDTIVTSKVYQLLQLISRQFQVIANDNVLGRLGGSLK